MAVIESIKGLKVTIQSGAKTLPEFPDEGEWTGQKLSAHQRTSTYVESVSGAEFELRFDLVPNFKFKTDSVTLWVDVDGNRVGGIVFARNGPNYLTRQTFSGCDAGTVGGEKRLRPLKFSNITKVDDGNKDRIIKDVALAKNLGQVTVTVHNTNSKIVPITASGTKGFWKERTVLTEIAEKALKGQAISHGVSYGDEKRSPGSNTICEISYPYQEKNPRGVLIFKYRSREDLQSEMIIPRSPSPNIAGLPDAEPSNAATAAQVAKLKEEIARLQSGIKKEGEAGKRGHDDEGSEIPHRDRPYKVKRKHDGKIVVDLTDDD